MGCGPMQENSYNCADISIQDELDGNVEFITKKSTTSAPITRKRHTTHQAKSHIKPISYSNKCQTKLNYGKTLSIKALMDIFCGNVCSDKCPILIEDLNSNLKNGDNTEPSKDLIACLDTCPLVCDC